MIESPSVTRLAKSEGMTELSPTKLGMTSGRPSTIEFVGGQTTRLACKIKMGLSDSSFVLYREDGARLAGDAGPAGHHGPIVLICGLLGFAVGIIGLAAMIQGILDLVKMSKGEMNPSGRTLTIIGMILGAIGFVLKYRSPHCDDRVSRFAFLSGRS